MKILNIIIYTIFLILSILKYYAISKTNIQETASYYILFIAIYFFILYFKEIKIKLTKTCFLYLLALCLSAVHLFEGLTFVSFIDSLLFPLLFLTSYIFFSKYPQYIVVMKYLGIFLLILSYYNLLRLSAMANERTSVTIQSNAGNSVVALLPFAFLWKNKIVKYAFIIVAFFACLIALKRSAFVIFVLVLFTYLLLRKKTNILKGIVIYSVIIALVGTILLPRIESAERMIERLEGTAEDGGSGRDKLATRCLEYQSESDFLEWMMGNGYLAFKKESARHGHFNTGAHNDFTEILYAHGIFAYTLFILLLWQLFKHIVKRRKEEHYMLIPIATCFVTYIIANLLVGPSVHFWYYLPMFCLYGGVCSLPDKPQNQTTLLNK